MTKFKIKTESSPYYFMVTIFDTAIDMRKHYKKVMESMLYCFGPVSKRVDIADGFTIPYKKYKNKKVMRVIGEILLSKEYMKLYIICHELAHAAHWYDMCINKSAGEKYFGTREEAICDIHGELVDSFAKQLFEARRKHELML